MRRRTAILFLLGLLPPTTFTASAQNAIIDSIAGGGPDNLPAIDPPIWPSSVLATASGEVYVVGLNQTGMYGRTYRIDLGGKLHHVAGNGWGLPLGEGGPADLARIAGVGSVAVDAAGSLLIADSGNNRIRRVDAVTGIIETVAGSGSGGFGGDGGLSTLAKLSGPTALAVHETDRFEFGDNQRVRSVSATSLPTAAGDVPAGDTPPESPLVITHAPLGQVTLSWDASCLATDTDYELYAGALGSFTSDAPITCKTGNATSVTMAPPPGDVYYLVVPRSYAREGSYGRDAAGMERPPSVSACMPQETRDCP